MVGHPEFSPQNYHREFGDKPDSSGKVEFGGNNARRHQFTQELIDTLRLPTRSADRDEKERLIYNFALQVLYEKLSEIGIIEPDVDFDAFSQQSGESGIKIRNVIFDNKVYQVAEIIGITTSCQFGGENKRIQIANIDTQIKNEEMECGYINGAPPSEKLLKLRAVRNAIERGLEDEEKWEVVTYELHLPSLFTDEPRIGFGEPRVVRRKMGNRLNTQSTSRENSSSQADGKLDLDKKIGTRTNPTKPGAPMTSSNGDVTNLVNSGVPSQLKSDKASASTGTSLSSALKIGREESTLDGYFKIPRRLSTYPLTQPSRHMESQNNSDRKYPKSLYLQQLKAALIRIFKNQR